MHHSAVVESAWPRCGCNIRVAVIHGSELGAIRASGVFVLRLHTSGLNMLFSGSLSFLRALLRANAAVAPVIANPGRIVIVVGDSGVIGIVNDGYIDVVHGAVVSEMPAFPASAQIANSHVSKSIIHAAVKSDVRSPVTGVPEVAAIAPTPVAGSPKNPHTGSQHPGSGNPIIIIISVGPITRRPDIPFTGAYRLLINRQYWRGNPHGNAHADLRERGRRYGEHDGGK